MSQPGGGEEDGAQPRPPPWKYPGLPAPEDLPRFAEEGARDPFGQNQEMLEAASRNAFHIAAELAELAHARGLSMMLPSPEPMMVDPALRPWRNVVSCMPAQPGQPAAVRIPPPFVTGDAAHNVAVEDLVQRAMVSLASLTGVRSETYGRAAELLEDLGYIALSREYQERKLDWLPDDPRYFFYSVGESAAKLHEHNAIHGDIHPGNFLMSSGEREAMVSDVGTVCFLERPLTTQERASDLGLLKLSCPFLLWEVAKLGYRRHAPEAAAEVFRLI